MRTDTEMVARYRRNLTELDLRNQGVDPATDNFGGEGRIAGVLAGLDSITGDTAEDESTPARATDQPAPRNIQALKAKFDQQQADHRKRNRSTIQAMSASARREKYREAKEATGDTVRPYNRNLANMTAAERAEHRRKQKRRSDRKRYREQHEAKGAAVRTNSDLSAMTPEQKAEHRRALARERKRRSRARKNRQRHLDATG